MLEPLVAEKRIIDGHRRYFFRDNGDIPQPFRQNGLPSVTAILHETAFKPQLIAWRKRVGEEEANRIARQAAIRGEAIHKLIQDYVFHNIPPEDVDEDIAPWWNSVLPVLKGVRNPLLIEGPIWHSSGYAGTVDFVGYFGDTLVVADWKTSARERPIEYVGDYFLQVTAYAAALNQRYGTSIEDAAIVIALPDADAQVYHIDRPVLKKCWARFSERLAGFYEKHPLI